LTNHMSVSCKYCAIRYCSTRCRHRHWVEHAADCYLASIGRCIRQLISQFEQDYEVNQFLGRLASHGFGAYQRGCLIYKCPSLDDAKFLMGSSRAVLDSPPVYFPLNDIRAQNSPSMHLKWLTRALIDYDPEQEFVINFSVNAFNSTNVEMHTNGPIQARSCTVLQCARIPLDLGRCNAALSTYEIRTFSLPKTKPDEENEDSVSERRYYSREVAFHLHRCGVHLRRDYPTDYEVVSDYVASNASLHPPLHVYGQADGRNYKCVVTTEGEMTGRRGVSGAGVLV